ncbi:hypothetical protein [Coleofasciculus sp. G2-EDA-02]|uniref:hypothetical protein n=1 Tax=Coleofasciculus sp. G2-EDA-02 TaxID=3069529 RepID=UPI0032FD32C6
MIQTVLYGVFCIAAIAYFLGLRFLLESYLTQLTYFGCLSFSWVGFTLLWSVGIVSVTQAISGLISRQHQTESTGIKMLYNRTIEKMINECQKQIK